MADARSAVAQPSEAMADPPKRPTRPERSDGERPRRRELTPSARSEGPERWG
jgi:hypothetical protein